MTNAKDLDQTSVYTTLEALAKTPFHLRDVLTPERMANYCVSNGPISLFYGASLVNETVLSALQSLADEQQVIPKYQALLAGNAVNVGENRKVLHHQTRSSQDRGFYGAEQLRIATFAESVRSGLFRGYTGKKFKTVVQLGIGGSDLGPRALYLALERYVISAKQDQPIKALFAANVDPDDMALVLSHIDFESTLFVVVSKSGTTQETLTNLAFVQEKALAYGMSDADLCRHFVAVTGKGSPLDDPARYLMSFYIDDFIGGRYSSTSAVGGVVLSLAFGADTFEAFLRGAGQMDEAALEPSLCQNMALLSACIGVWERSFLGFPAKAVIPYAESLSRFPAHLQQLDCESNGKSVNTRFESIGYQTGPLIFGEPGTNGQHSFFQKLHQGSDCIPIQFLGFKHPQMFQDITTYGSTSQDKLIANMVAQIIALAVGKDHENANKAFPGNRPSSLIFADQLTPEVLGALLAFYENVVMFQGFLWNLNSFDQEGVQLGKVLTQKILDPTTEKEALLSSFFSLLR